MIEEIQDYRINATAIASIFPTVALGLIKLKLVLSEFGLFLRRKRNRFQLSGKDIKKEFLSNDVEEIHFLNPGVGVSISAIRLALENEIFVVLGSRSGWPHGFVIPTKISGTIRGKRAQFLAFSDPRGVHLARRFAQGKARNQRNLLRLIWKNRTRTEPELAEKLYKASEHVDEISKEFGSINGNSIDKVRVDIMNVEARASKAYWDAISPLIPEELKFSGRKTRGATDPFNAMLNFGYKAILFPESWKAVYYAGLDPYAGFLHADKPGKPSLALDLMEEFRQHTVDRVLLTIFSKNMLKIDDIMDKESTVQPRLSKNTIKVLTERINEQLDDNVQYNGSKIPLKNAIVNQARGITNYLLGANREYVPFELVW
ncbi:MAG: CRISPR-associated endonuclease Cas1 [Nitrososphaerales archaeon]